MPATTQDDAALSAQLKDRSNSQQASYAHMHTLQPAGSAAPQQQATATGNGSDSSQNDQIGQQESPAAPPVQTASDQSNTPSSNEADPAILSLANNNDLNVSTLARQAHKAKGEPPQDEVIIALH